MHIRNRTDRATSANNKWIRLNEHEEKIKREKKTKRPIYKFSLDKIEKFVAIVVSFSSEYDTSTICLHVLINDSTFLANYSNYLPLVAI